MKGFHYTALDARGRRLSGVGYASNRQMLRDRLIDARLHPLGIRPVLFQSARRLSLSEAEAARLARDLAQLLESGLSLVQSLSLMEVRETARLGAVLRDIRTRVAAGEPLSRALTSAEGRASRFLQALARAGEATGRQADVLASGAATMSRSDALRKRLLTLSLYPGFVILIAFLSIGVYAYAVLPALEPAFESLGDQVPVQTRTVLTFGWIIRLLTPWLAVTALASLAAFTVSVHVRRWVGRWSASMLLAPKRSPLKDFVYANLASRLSVMLGAGVPLASAWKLAREPVEIDIIANSLAGQDERLLAGAQLSDALAASRAVPADMLHYVGLGEQSGRLPKSLADASGALGARAQETIERVLSVVTPLVIVVVGALVGLITLMVFQGLLAVGDAVAI